MITGSCDGLRRRHGVRRRWQRIRSPAAPPYGLEQVVERRVIQRREREQQAVVGRRDQRVNNHLHVGAVAELTVGDRLVRDGGQRGAAGVQPVIKHRAGHRGVGGRRRDHVAEQRPGSGVGEDGVQRTQVVLERLLNNCCPVAR